MKLIKLTDDHYVIVDKNAEIKEGDWYVGLHNKVIKATDGKHYAAEAVRFSGKPVYKITHSTQPISEKCKKCNGFCDVCTDSCKVIFYNEIKELIGEVDVEKKYNETWLAKYQPYDSKEGIAFKTGYNQAIEDNKKKKYTEEDVIAIVEKSRATGLTAEYIIQSLQQPPTQWNVEFDSQYKLKLI